MALVTSEARAEVPLRRPDELKRESTHIIVGKLRMVYRSVEPGGDFEQTRGIAEIVVEKVEKGVGPNVGEVVYARFWNQRWVGKGEVPPHSRGHRVPTKSAAVRAYLKRDQEGSYDVLLPNGLAVVTESTTRPR
jgi:hypothetical protein